MAKLYPPNINGTIPAFCKEDGTVIITVPFSMNKAVSKTEVSGFALKIKTVSGTLKGVIKTTTSKASSYDMEESYQANFNVTHLDFSIGQYYKVQLAYINQSGIVGYYSTVGVGKYTTRPQISIEGLKFGRINSHNYFYTGIYSQKDGDTTEKLYSTRFRLYNSEKEVIQDTGEVLHNVTEDDLSYEAHATFSVPQDLELDKSYYIKFTATTTNNLTVNTSYYRIMQRRSVSPEIKANLVASLNHDEGHIVIGIQDDYDAVISGAFLISRASSLNGYAWEEFKRFDLQSMVPNKWSLLDCTVEQGATYRYSLQQYNSNGIYSDRIVSNDVSVDFEDMFLYDGECQLNIRFNPKVSSYKTDILESKTDTIGSQYPFITRNGNVNYKEFSISGLISYQMDNVNLFMTKEELHIEENSTQLTKENITAERLFKNKVLDWLNNGKPKIFRSPSEGNYIVRLMNVSLSPTDSLSRMLHTFSCQAYEIAKFNIDNLKYYNLVDANEDFAVQTRWKTYVLRDLVIDEDLKKKSQKKVFITSTPAYSVSFTEMMPGSKVYINDTVIVIGATGSYYAEFPEKPVSYIYFDYTPDMSGLMTFSYRTKSITVFGTITDVSIIDVPVHQFIGDEYKKKTLVNTSGLTYTTDNIFEAIQDIKTEVLNAYFIKVFKREIQYLYMDKEYVEGEDFKLDESNFKNMKYYNDMYCKDREVDLSTLNDWTIYYVRFKRGSVERPFPNEGYYVETNNTTFAPYTGMAIDGNTGELFEVNNSTFSAFIDDEEVNVFDTQKYELMDASFVKKLELNKGVIAEISYSKQNIDYIFESSKDSKALKNKKVWLSKKNNFQKILSTGGHRGDLANAKKAMDNAYIDFLKVLNVTIQQYKEVNGI